MEPGSTHQQLDLVVAQHDTPAECQLGMHPPGGVGNAALDVDLADEVAEHRVPDTAFGRRTVPVLIESGLGDTKDPARDLAGLPRRSLRPPRSDFWAGFLLEQVHRPASDSQLGLEFADPLVRRRKLTLLGTAQAGRLAPINPVLSAPVVDRLDTNVQIVRDASHTAPLREQIEDLASELCRIALFVPSVPPDDRHQNPQIPTPQNPGHNRVRPTHTRRLNATREHTAHNLLLLSETTWCRLRGSASAIGACGPKAGCASGMSRADDSLVRRQC